MGDKHTEVKVTGNRIYLTWHYMYHYAQMGGITLHDRQKQESEEKFEVM